MKLKPIFRYNDQSPHPKPVQFAHWCPACNESHAFSVVGEHPRLWSFDGNMESPTFHPSMRISGGYDAAAKRFTRTDCHYFLKAGKIKYCDDHPKGEWRGKEVPLPDFPEGRD